MPVPDVPPVTVRGHRDFQRLWTGLGVSQLGSAVGMVALPIIAVTVLEASGPEVALLAACTAITTTLLALPMGGAVEFRRKRPILIAADLVRFASLLSIPVAFALGSLVFAQLCVVAVVNAAGQVAFASASQAHLKALVSADRLVDANSRLESTLWLSVSVGPSLGGALVGFVTVMGTMIVDALSFVASALAIRRIRAVEPPAPIRDRSGTRRSELVAGLGFVRAHPVLRPMLISWVTFAGAVMMAAPLITVLYLRELGFTPWQYGLLLGVPSLGGFLGARSTRRVVARFGAVRTLRWAGLLRGPWQFLIPLAAPGVAGLLLCGAATFGVLFFAGMANSAANSYRQLQTPDHLMARVSTLWAFATTAAQPAFIVAGGLLATVLPIRVVIVLAAALMVSSALLLPRRQPTATTP